MVAHMRAPDDFDMIVAEAPAQEASSPASALSTPSVPESLEFTETNPEGIDAIGQEAPAIEQEAPGDTVMNDTESEGEGGEISTGGNFALFMAQVCLSFFLKFKNT